MFRKKNMIVYNVLLIALVSMALLLNYFKTKKNNKVLKRNLFCILFSYMILILGLRDINIGLDVPGYIVYFKNVNNLSYLTLINDSFEKGYKFLNVCIAFFTQNENIFLFIVSLLCLVPVGRFIYKYSEMPFLTTLIYISFNFYAFTFSGLRQAVAFAIVMISYDFIIKKKFSNYCICIMVAMLFHKTAFIFIPAYFFYNIKISEKIILLLAIVDIIIYIFRKTIMEFLVLYIFTDYGIIESNAYSWFFLSFVLVTAGLMFYKNVTKIYPETNGLYMYVLLGVSMMLMTSIGSNVLRMANYYYIYIIILIPKIIKSFEEKYTRFILTFLIVILCLGLFIWFYSIDAYHIVPYKLFFARR